MGLQEERNTKKKEKLRKLIVVTGDNAMPTTEKPCSEWLH